MADPTTLTLLLGRLARLEEATVTDVCSAHGTTPAELRVLLFLAHAPAGAASPSEVATFVVQTTGGLTATLRRLETAGHVERRPDPDDGRGRLVALTGAGRAFEERVTAAVVDRVMGALGTLDLDAVDAHVRLLVDAFERSTGHPSSTGFVAGVVPVPR
jgi:DNA-binding MarR family transcriptional regulator